MRAGGRFLVAAMLVAACASGCRGTDGRAREAVLRTNLRTMREAIAQYRADKGRHPHRLEELVAEGYLRTMPMNPVAKNNSAWREVLGVVHGRRQVVGVRSAVGGTASDGSRFEDW